MSDPITTMALVAGSAFLGKFVGPAAEQLGKGAWERMQEIGAKALVFITAAGREPQPIDEKTFYTLVQGAVLEADPILIEKWAALLANAADPAQKAPVQPSFVEVLRQLTPDDTQVLSFIYEWLLPYDGKPFGGKNNLTIRAIFSHFKWGKDRIEISLDNLLRLRLFESLTGGLDTVTSTSPEVIIMPTQFGSKFLRAVTPPNS